ncbi:eukaryotic aspartyl protease [Colletotrichum karsti]|uniref:Eukaryotic aspartyl protease n=1 Tax=Colletotrichum karsti TaxID=1095194 RepID=A0A9P6IDD9_9PEZI|nr:eukaryotic aspartyl protease [Colletotrichum karsti]KAF9880404.1 eukaryotic aspartyl protease [Colletotrichum karsti]
MRTQSLAMMALANGALAAIPTVNIPLHYYYGGGHKIATNLVNPNSNKSVEVVFDQGSENFWVFGPNAINNWGCTGFFCQGQCNATAEPFYDYPNSPTAKKPESFPSQFAYGAYTKIVQGHETVNDTFLFASDSGLTSTVAARVAIADYMQQRLPDGGTCTPAAYDLGILGVAPFYRTEEWNTTGPHVRQDLLERGEISAPVQSIWFDEAPANWDGTFTGNAVFGAIDHSKYTGDLVKVPPIKNDRLGASVGYFVAPPTVKVKNVTLDNKDLSSHACMIDSGTQIDDLPISSDAIDAFYGAAGLARDSIGHTAWNGTCDSIPKDLTIDLEFAGVGDEKVTIKIPLRNYVRNNADAEAQFCALNIDTGGCMLGAPFATATFFAADDAANEIALAQGGVSKRGSKPDEASLSLTIA